MSTDSGLVEPTNALQTPAAKVPVHPVSPVCPVSKPCQTPQARTGAGLIKPAKSEQDGRREDDLHPSRGQFGAWLMVVVMLASWFIIENTLH